MKLKRYNLYLLILLAACNGTHQETTAAKDILSIKDTTQKKSLEFKDEEGLTGQASQAINVGEIISFVAGRFSNQGKTDTAYVIKTKQGEGVPVDGGIPDEYALRFTGSSKSINIGCCDARLVNEGDLNKDGKEEVSVFQYPENGTVCHFTTYTTKKEDWKELFDMFLVTTGGDAMTDSTLQDLVVKRNDTVYYTTYVDTNETFIPVKERGVLK